MSRVSGRRVVLPDGVATDTAVLVDEGRIVGLEPSRAPEFAIVAPGFVDLQVNGHGAVDVATTDRSGWRRLLGALAAQGVTTWCPTLITAPTDVLEQRVATITSFVDEPGPAVAGVHLEGPYLGRATGAHPVTEGPIDRDWLLRLGDALALVTLGPEREGARAAIADLTGRGVTVALGHTMATAAETEAAVEAGATVFTHAFNASGVLHHREPGALGVALTDDRLTITLIADGVHVDRRILRLAWRAKPRGRVALVTDAVGWEAGRIADRGVTLVDRAPRLADGTLAGSALTMDAAVRYTVEEVGIDLVDALAAAAAVPADVLGLDDRGRITPGRRADLVALTDDVRVAGTWVAGERCYSRTGSGS